MNNRPMSRRFLALGAAAVMVLAACGSDDADSSGEPLPAATESPDGGDTTDGPTTQPVELSPDLEIDGDRLSPLADPDDDPEVGNAAPVITGLQFDGSEITIGGPTDGPTMIAFLAHWCPHCNDEIPEILELHDNDELPEGLNVVAVSTSVAADRDNFPPSEWMAEKGWPFPTLADSADSLAIQYYGGTAFPFTALVDEEGNVLARTTGSGSADQIKAWLDDSL